jgi:hypothetical protein
MVTLTTKKQIAKRDQQATNGDFSNKTWIFFGKNVVY